MNERDWPSYMPKLAKLCDGALDATSLQRVRFRGVEYVLTEGGAIATAAAYEAGECSFAHLFPDGRIMRFRKQIGTREDLTFLSEPKP